MGGAQAKFAALAIHQVEHDPFAGRVASPAATALPQLGGLQLGQQGFQGTGGIKFLAHNCRNLLQNPPQQGQISVDTGTDATDVTSAQQQAMGDNLGFSRVVPQRHQHQAGNAHGE